MMMAVLTMWKTRSSQGVFQWRGGRPDTLPQLLWVTCGNVTNERLRQVFATVFSSACALVRIGRSVRYRLSDLDAWLSERRVTTRDQAE
jgi:hypothetical protein